MEYVYKVFKNGHFWKTAFKKFEAVVCLSRPYPSDFFKACLPKILLGSFLNILPDMLYWTFTSGNWKLKATQYIIIRPATHIQKPAYCRGDKCIVSF